MLDAISIGDVTEDVFVEVEDALVKELKVGKRKEEFLCLRYADKIKAPKIDKLIGGNAGNFAIGSERLGIQSALYAEVGDDIQGARILQSLKENKVSTKYFTLVKGGKTNYSVVINHDGERTILVHHELRKYKPKKLEKCKWLYVTSMGKGSDRLFPPVIKHVKKYKTKLGFNPGTHQLEMGLKKLSSMLKHTTVVSLNKEETQLLLNNYSEDFRVLTKELWKTGTNIALVTDGPNGSYCFDGKEFWYCPIYDVPAIERTGCGDSFTTAFIVALHYGKSVPEAMAWASINSASVLQKIGPQEGLIKLSMLKKILKANPKYKARAFNSAKVLRNKKYLPKKYKVF
jgi:ribokinase